MAKRSQPSEQPKDPKNLQGVPNLTSKAILVSYKDTLTNIRLLLLGKMDFRTIQKSDIDRFEADLRAIITELENLRNDPDIDNLLASVDAVQTNLRSVLNNLYSASDVLEKGNTIANREKRFYPRLTACPPFLLTALEQFKV